MSTGSLIKNWYGILTFFIIGISKFLPSFPGMLLEKEVSNLKKLITNANYNTAVAVFGKTNIHER